MSKGRGPKIQLQKPPTQQPRSKDEIEAEYSRDMAGLAQASYLKHVWTVSVDNINANLVRLNQELKARNDLDAKQKESNEPEQP